MIISGGFNIWPAELENVIQNHPAVVEVAVVAIPHERWGEAPMALCVVAAGAAVTEADIVSLCVEHLGSYKKPAHGRVPRPSRFPRARSASLQRKVLREPYWSGRERRVAGN